MRNLVMVNETWPSFTSSQTGSICSDAARLQLQEVIQWIGFGENLQETIDFPIKYGAFL